MKLYADYIKERHNKDFIEIQDKGFATFSIECEENINYILVYDFYVIPEERGNSIAKDLFLKLQDISEKNNCKFAMTQVDVKSNGWQRALNFQIKCGMEIISFYNDVLTLRKNL